MDDLLPGYPLACHVCGAEGEGENAKHVCPSGIPPALTARQWANMKAMGGGDSRLGAQRAIASMLQPADKPPVC